MSLKLTIEYISSIKTGGKNMKKIVGIAILLLVCASIVCGVVAAENSVGPAPNSGDCVPDRSGFDQPNWQNPDNPGRGPAPNAGDGIPDGNGF
jgi:hypothetical protein